MTTSHRESPFNSSLTFLTTSVERGLLPARSWNHWVAISFRFRPRGTGKKLSLETASFRFWLSCTQPFRFFTSRIWVILAEYCGNNERWYCVVSLPGGL